ncbi:MAG: iron ABC transporter permease [Oscillospiraceae bacterium]|nr:iron ABC transporter permease [Oscillospiraceae bacterium]
MLVEQKRRIRSAVCFAALGAALLALLALNLAIGTARLPLREVWNILLRREGDNAAIVWGIRLPRLLTAALLGGALAVSGFLLQTFFGNPIAGPFVLGISSSAKLVVALVMVASLARGAAVSSLGMVVAAFCGAMLSMGLILLASRRLKSMALLIVCGVMIGYICSAVTDIVVTFASDSNIVNLHNWSLGSFSGKEWRDVGMEAVIVLAALLGAFLLSKPMGAYQLGEGYARSMGVNIRRFRAELIALTGVLSACVTAFAGPISFVGIAVPHLMKQMFRTAKPILMVPACFLGGGVFCLLCDLIARTLFAPTELSISSVTAVFGVPVVLWMLLARQKRKEGV